MKNISVFAGILATVAGVALTGCVGQDSFIWDASENSIYVSDSLSVQSSLVYTSDQDNELYDADGLRAYVEEAVDAYNEAHSAADGTLPVTLVSCSLDGRTGSLTFAYADAADYLSFAEETGDNTNTVTDLQVATVADGLPDHTSFQTASGKSTSVSDIEKRSEYRLVILEGSAAVFTEGKIAYVSEGVQIRHDHAAVTPEGSSCIVFR
ncbi:MAG: hypothetical protein LUE65_10545 [Clostridiales bacterium]|nr:hypothetical protein [Clostridiales bacterium]